MHEKGFVSLTDVMRGSRNFRGGPGQSEKSSDSVFFFFFFLFFFFLVLRLCYRNQMVNFKENYHSTSNIFQGGPTFSRGGVQLLIPYRNPYNL